MAASCSAGQMGHGDRRMSQHGKNWFIEQVVDLPSVAIPNISFSVLTSEKFREHQRKRWFRKCILADKICISAICVM